MAVVEKGGDGGNADGESFEEAKDTNPSLVSFTEFICMISVISESKDTKLACASSSFITGSAAISDGGVSDPSMAEKSAKNSSKCSNSFR